jgi:hypothetical protein
MFGYTLIKTEELEALRMREFMANGRAIRAESSANHAFRAQLTTQHALNVASAKLTRMQSGLRQNVAARSRSLSDFEGKVS